jgi:hypothetical protein
MKIYSKRTNGSYRKTEGIQEFLTVEKWYCNNFLCVFPFSIKLFPKKKNLITIKKNEIALREEFSVGFEPRLDI